MIVKPGSRFVLIRPMGRGLIHATGSEQLDGLTYCGRRPVRWRIATDREHEHTEWCGACRRVACG